MKINRTMNRHIFLEVDNTKYGLCIVDNVVAGFSINDKMYLCNLSVKCKNTDIYTCSEISSLEDLKEFLNK